MPDHIPFDAILTASAAAGEATRLRLLALLAEAELTVSEFVTILGQSQPRRRIRRNVLNDVNEKRLGFAKLRHRLRHAKDCDESNNRGNAQWET